MRFWIRFASGKGATTINSPTAWINYAKRTLSSSVTTAARIVLASESWPSIRQSLPLRPMSENSKTALRSAVSARSTRHTLADLGYCSIRCETGGSAGPGSAASARHLSPSQTNVINSPTSNIMIRGVLKVARMEAPRSFGVKVGLAVNGPLFAWPTSTRTFDVFVC
jgi:hypothetical protein